jgi:redox-sensitive bicupin YhaK (pirin superfamily)
MSAGKGIVHSEFSEFSEDPVRLPQIWIEPAESDDDKQGRWRLIASLEVRDGSWSRRFGTTRRRNRKETI